MKEKRAQLEHRLAFYHQNEALLFQFLLHECLRAHEILKKKPDRELFRHVVGNFDFTSSTWHAPYGHLPRLFHYCSLLTFHFNDPTSSLCQDLRQTLEKAFLIAKPYESIFESGEKDLSKLYNNLKKEMRHFIYLLFEKLEDFCNNASVLFFLLRHQQQIDTLCKEPIVKKIFHAFFPNGMKQAQTFLTEKLSKKGFHHLIPFIEHKLKTLD